MFRKFQILVFGGVLVNWTDHVLAKRVKIHVPVKVSSSKVMRNPENNYFLVQVKHHHHTHTVVKHIHHQVRIIVAKKSWIWKWNLRLLIHKKKIQVPVHVAPDHEEVHVFNPGSQEQIFDSSETWQSRKSRPTKQHPFNDYPHYGDSQRERELEYVNFDKVLKKHRSKKNHKIFSNTRIGWSGRNDFDKIANEYLESLRNQKIPPPDNDEEDFPTYTDDDHWAKFILWSWKCFIII